tara:strand:- start:1832 stop:3187 length:1356 start_codon:yes stop_codon:yes gene_type:complete
MAYSKFDDIALPVPPVMVKKDYLNYISEKLPTFLSAQYLALLDLITSLQAEFIVKNEQIFDLSAEKISENTQFLNNVYVGAESKIALDGPNNNIVIKDSQGTPQTRVKIGKLGSGTDNYGVQVSNASGTVKFQTGSTTFIDGGIISANTVTATQIAADTITASQMAADSITATEIDVSNLAAINADLGNITAGTVTGVTMTANTFRTAASGARIQFTTTGIDSFKADGTQVIDIDNDGKFRFGPSGGNNIYWNNSTLAITGEIITTGNITEGAATNKATVTLDASSVDGDITLTGTNHPTATGYKKGATVTMSEQTIGTVTINTLGRDVLIFFNPTITAADVPEETGVTMQTLNFDATIKIKKGSTVLATTSILGGNSTASNSNTITSVLGGSISALDASPNGSLSSAADTVYTCTLTITDYTTTEVPGGIGHNKKSIVVSGNIIAVEMRV